MVKERKVLTERESSLEKREDERFFWEVITVLAKPSLKNRTFFFLKNRQTQVKNLDSIA